MIASSTSSHIWLPKIVEAGKCGSSSEPLRKTVWTGANRPWLVGVVSPPAASSIRNAIRIAPIADAARHVREARRLVVGLARSRT